MFMSLVSIAIVLGIAYLWVTRGFFSALLHMVCVISAGAIAFAVWEPASLLLLERAPDGFFSFIGDAAWGLGLALPFAISLALLRVATDSILRANIIVDDAMNYVGGGICGAVSGIITAGVFVNSVAFMRLPQSFMGYQPLAVANQGNFELQQNLWLPVDRLTGAFYNHLSEHVLSTPTPLARLHPDLATAAGAQRMSGGEGKNRNTLTPEAFDVLGWFSVGRDASAGPDALLADFINPRAQTINDLDGTARTNIWLAGFIVRFNAAAREQFGQVVASKGQYRLITENDAGDRRVEFPIAVTSQARAGEDIYGRFRFETEGEHIASVGGAAEATMAFEFPVTRGYRPIALYVKNIRHDVEGEPTQTFADALSRDIAIQSGQLAGGRRAENLVLTNAVTATSSGDGAPGVTVSVRIPRKYSLQEGATRGLQIDDDNKIIDGDESFEPGALGARVDANLRVDQFFVTADTNIVQVTVTGEPDQIPSSLFGPASVELDPSSPPQLVDADGRVYPAVGFIYEDRGRVRIRYTPSRPMRALNEAPSLSRTRDDQEMVLLFRISKGVAVEHLTIGDIVITTYDEPIAIDAPRIR
ncbi:MAG: hypothetical protein ACTS22_03270 [Phycisphaerales bacterium]